MKKQVLGGGVFLVVAPFMIGTNDVEPQLSWGGTPAPLATDRGCPAGYVACEGVKGCIEEGKTCCPGGTSVCGSRGDGSGQGLSCTPNTGQCGASRFCCGDTNVGSVDCTTSFDGNNGVFCGNACVRAGSRCCNGGDCKDMPDPGSMTSTGAFLDVPAPPADTGSGGCGGGSSSSSSGGGSSSSGGSSSTSGSSGSACGPCRTDADCAGFGRRHCSLAVCGQDKQCHCCYATCGAGSTNCTCIRCSTGCGVAVCMGTYCAFQQGGRTCD